MSDRDLTSTLKTAPGSQAAWDKWFRYVFPRVYYSLFQVTDQRSETARDLTQSAIERFIRYRALDKVTSDTESIAYLVTSGRRIYADEVQATSQEVSETWARSLGEDDRRRFDELLDLEALVASLDENEQAAIRLHLEGFSIKDISTKLGISYDAAGKRISRARKNMKIIVKKSAKSRFTR